MQGANNTILSMLAETLEDAVSRFHRPDSLQAQVPLANLINEGLTTWGSTSQVLKKLSFDPEAAVDDDGCWKILGLSALHGPAPSTGDIHARLKLADIVAQVANQPEWSELDRSRALVFRENAGKAVPSIDII